MEAVHNFADNRQITRVLNEVVRQFNSTGKFTLANSVTTTTVIEPKVRVTSNVFLQPTNANAAGSGAFIVSKSNGSFVVGHASAATSRTFDYVVFGV
jgi:hypothetical protein